MPNRLEPVNLADFTGGLNLRRNQFQLQPNESPEMNNINVDPLGGIYTRRGFDRWNEEDIVDPDVDDWDPRRALLHQLSNGTDVVYIANDNALIYTDDGGLVWDDAGITVNAAVHMADFAVFGDDIYVAAGKTEPGARRIGTGAFATLTVAGPGTWNDDYTTPTSDVMPEAELCEMHSGYLFVANTIENSVDCPNRLRWSHPTSPGDWAEADYIDIEVGGASITALLSYEDHLLIFKADGVWALYGYDLDSWQLVQKSSTSGAISPIGVSRSETTAFWYSASDKGAIFAYGGDRPVEISEKLRTLFETIISPDLVWVGWIARRLWVMVPWNYDAGPSSTEGSMLVFDPSVGEGGAWMYYSTAEGSVGPIVGGSNTDSQIRPMAVMRVTETPSIIMLEALDVAADRTWTLSVLGLIVTEEGETGILVTGLDEELIATGIDGGYEPFETVFRTGWIDGGWPSRKKSFRRPDFICRRTGFEHRLRIQSFRDYDETSARRQSTLLVPAGVGDNPVWGTFDWGDGTEWGGAGPRGGVIRRGSSYGLAKALQVRLRGMDAGESWGVDAIILKHVMRRFR